jgi:5-formyltetrahydrofolate cyclo-ligase
MQGLHDIAERKLLQRKAGIAARKALDKETAALYSGLISQRLLDAGCYGAARTVFSYQAFNGEADVALFNGQAVLDGKRVAYPICYGGGRMIAAVPLDADAWETGKYGIRAPKIERSTVIDPAEIDMVIVPCTAFDGASRLRVGMGAGYYDRYLPQCVNAFTVAAAFEVQAVADELAHDQWDVALCAIATEKNWYTA